MKYGSVCSGVEAATVAWHPLGWEPQWFSEIEKFPSAVLAHHYPNVPNLGDMTQFKEWPNDPIDLLVGGTPCQSFSIAGLRKGLDDPRGNLMLTYLAIAARYQPKWLVWENVPGVLSSDRGRDFGTFLGALGQLGYGFAYRVLDAQYFGVAQRRRRVFVVGYLGDWRRAAAVLFERESMSGHPAPSREAREEVARGSGNSADANGPKWPADLASTLNAAFGSKQGLEDQHINSGAPLFVPQSVGSLCARTGRSISAQDAQQGHLIPSAFPAEMSGTQAASAVNISPALSVKHTTAVAWPVGGNQGGDFIQQQAVRRLTPTECERLQGFPDDYTQIPWGNKDAENCPVGPRYKAMGNSMAVPVMRWIGERIQLAETL